MVGVDRRAVAFAGARVAFPDGDIRKPLLFAGSRIARQADLSRRTFDVADDLRKRFSATNRKGA